MTQPDVEIHPDSDAVVGAGAARFVAVVTQAQTARGHAAVVLTGGGTGIALLAAVRRNPGSINWRQLDVFFGDERFVPADDPDRNVLQAQDALLDHVPLDPSRVHPMGASGPHADPANAAKTYASLVDSYLAERGGFDLHLLGMGEEGHVNSLFPHTPAVAEQHELVVAVSDSPKPPPLRVTLTLPAVRRARHVALVVSGAGKAAAVAAALGGAAPAEVPAAGAVGSQSTTWLLDTAAASKLPG